MIQDRDVIRVLERSAVVGALDRIGARLAAAVRSSYLLAQLRVQWDAVRARPGTTLLTATAVHLILQGALARPTAGYWLILPSIYVLAAVMLMVMVDSKQTRRG